MIVLLGCAGIVEVEPGAMLGGEGPYDSSQPAADGPHMRLVPGGPEYRAYFTVELFDAGSVDGVYDGWCTNSHAPAPGAGWHPVELHWSDGAVPEGIVAQPENLGLLNYLLNAYEVGDLVEVGSSESDSPPVIEPLSDYDLQDAVWALIDDADGASSYLPPIVAEVVEEARAEGEGFVPGCGDVVVVLTVPFANLDGTTENDVQTVGVEIPFPSAHCP